MLLVTKPSLGLSVNIGTELAPSARAGRAGIPPPLTSVGVAGGPSPPGQLPVTGAGAVSAGEIPSSPLEGGTPLGAHSSSPLSGGATAGWGSEAALSTEGAPLHFISPWGTGTVAQGPRSSSPSRSSSQRFSVARSCLLLSRACWHATTPRGKAGQRGRMRQREHAKGNYRSIGDRQWKNRQKEKPKAHKCRCKFNAYRTAKLTVFVYV